MHDAAKQIRVPTDERVDPVLNCCARPLETVGVGERDYLVDG
jgi:hypothetical protein